MRAPAFKLSGVAARHDNPRWVRSAVISYDDAENDLDIQLEGNDGLVHHTTYCTTTDATDSVPGQVAGHVEFRKVSKGTDGPPTDPRPTRTLGNLG